VDLALGLGKYIVDGGVTLRFSPYHPNNILQLSALDLALRDTQRKFYALDLNYNQKDLTVDDAFNLLPLTLKDAEEDDSIRYISSTYNPNDQMIYDGYYPGGRKVISFANILQHDLFPLADVLKKILKVGQEEMGRPVEIEFAVNLKNKERAAFYLLQIRPIAQNKDMLNEDLSLIPQQETILSSTNALGNGMEEGVCDIVYVKTANFNAANNIQVASEIETINRKLAEENKEYILVGPGRWGSSDHWLGIPVKWPHITNARLLVECGLENYRIDPSQGTHFFQNLTSLGVGYFTINPFMDDGYFDEEYLNSLPAELETEYIRHVRLDSPTVIKINGKKRTGVVMKP